MRFFKFTSAEPQSKDLADISGKSSRREARALLKVAQPLAASNVPNPVNFVNPVQKTPAFSNSSNH
jgi:hypothetical protein